MFATILVAVAMASSPCSREQRPCYLRAGEPAPYSGELWPSAFAMAVLEDRINCEKTAADLKLANAKLDAEKALHEITKKQLTAEIIAEREAREAAEAAARALTEPPAWYERPVFVVVTTTLVVATTTYFIVRGR